ncbi:MAG: recombination-associated protein RdgC [Deltaproteobacteria bacterium]|nr:recombination-associated protein RdgC [Deltaproteobacteria bacterium]
MALASGSVSYLRFFVAPPPEGFERLYAEQLGALRFVEIDPRSEVEKVNGWVQFDDAFAGDFDPGTLVTPSGYLLFRLRIDTLKIPAGTMKAYVDQEAMNRCKAQNREKLSRKELDQLKLEVKKQLRLRSLPKLQLVDIAWNIQSGEVRLFSASKAVAAAFVELFEKTFQTNLQAVGLRSVLWLRGMNEAEVDSLSLLEPERFHLIPR